MKLEGTLALLLGTIVAIGALLGGVYTYGERRYASGIAGEHAKQEAATVRLKAQVDAYATRATIAEDAATQAREALVVKAQADAKNLPPRAAGGACDYPDDLLRDLNAIGFVPSPPAKQKKGGSQ